MNRAWHQLRRAATVLLPGGLTAILIAIAGTGAIRAEELPREVERFALPLPAVTVGVDSPAAIRLERSTGRSVAPLAARRVGPAFYDLHLLPRLNRQFREMGAYQAVQLSSDPQRQFVLFDLLTDTAQRRAERGTRKALVQYLLEHTAFGQRVDEFRDGHALAVDRGRRLTYGLGAYHGMPRLELRTQANSAVMRLGLSPDGSVGLSVSHQALTRARFYTGYHAGDDRYQMDLRVSF